MESGAHSISNLIVLNIAPLVLPYALEAGILTTSVWYSGMCSDFNQSQ